MYGGPLSQSVRNRFRAAESECEFGFLIASIDNRGTRNRGKAFESAAYMKLGDVDLKDQALGVQYLCRRSYVDPNRVDFVMLEDEVAQTGQGAIAVRSNEHLGRSDRGVFLLRKIWERELRNLAEGRPLKQWTYRPDMVPTYPKP